MAKLKGKVGAREITTHGNHSAEGIYQPGKSPTFLIMALRA